MVKTKNIMVIGSWAFLAGVVLAVVLGIVGPMSQTWTMLLVAVGLVVGLLNVTEREVMPFLLSGAVLILASALGGNVMGNIPYAASILDSLLLIFVPSTIIVAVKHVFNLARN